MSDKFLIDYVKTNLKTFDEEPFNDVDSLVFSWLVYIHFPKEIIKKEKPTLNFMLKSEYFDEMFDLPVSPDETRQLFFYVATSKRYRNIKILDFSTIMDQKSSTQFAAMVFRITKDLIYVAFRGTDSTFIGWKEDFHLLLHNPISSQLLGINYIKTISRHFKGAIIIGGHSKGGNIAVYSAVNSLELLHDRLVSIYSFDGPGFDFAEIQNDCFIRAKPLIIKYEPDGSLIGSLFYQETTPKFIKSNAIGFNQHNPLTWPIVNNSFIYADDLSYQSKKISAAITEVSEKLTDDEKVKLTNAIFDTLDKTEATSFNGFASILVKNIPTILNSVQELDDNTKALILSTIKELATSYIDQYSLFNYLSQKKNWQ